MMTLPNKLPPSQVTPPQKYLADDALRYYFIGEFEKGDAICRQIVAGNGGELGNVEQAAALIVSGRIGAETGMLADTLTRLFQAIQLLDEQNDPRLRAMALHSLAAAYYFDQKLNTALDFATQSMELCQEYDFAFELVDVLNTLAMIANEQTNHAAAFDHARRALELAQTRQNLMQQAQSLICCSICNFYLRNWDRSHQELLSAIRLSGADKNHFVVATAQAMLGSIYTAEGKGELAIIAFKKAIPLLQHYQMHPRLASVYYNDGLAKCHLRMYNEAENSILLALKIAEAFDWQLLMLNMHQTLAEIYTATKDPNKAQSHQKKAAALLKLREFYKNQVSFPHLGLKYPPADEISALERSINTRQLRTLDPATKYLNHFTFLANGRDVVKDFIEHQTPCQLLAISLRAMDPSENTASSKFTGNDLAIITSVLSRYIRVTDMVCSMPSGQILILMPATSFEVAAGVAAKISADLLALVENQFPSTALAGHSLCHISLTLQDRTFSHFINRGLLALTEA